MLGGREKMKLFDNYLSEDGHSEVFETDDIYATFYTDDLVFDGEKHFVCFGCFDYSIDDAFEDLSDLKQGNWDAVLDVKLNNIVENPKMIEDIINNEWIEWNIRIRGQHGEGEEYEDDEDGKVYDVERMNKLIIEKINKSGKREIIF